MGLPRLQGQPRLQDCVLYLRISSDRTGLRAGVERQERECRALAARLGLNVIRVYIDNDLSATTGKRRPEFERLLTDRPPVVIVWHTDRLIRKMSDLERVIPLDQTIHAVETSALDLATPAGRMVARQLTAVAQYEGEHRTARQRSASDQRALAGLPIRGGARPFGYYQGCTERAWHVCGPGGPCWTTNGTVAPDEAALIRSAAADVLAGATLTSIARAWNGTGIPSPAGCPWRMESIRTVLLNPRHAGLRKHRGVVLAGVAGTWEAILPEDVWRGVKATIEDPARRTADVALLGGARVHLLPGLTSCGRCGARMQTGQRRSGEASLQCSAGKHVERAAAPIEARVVEAVIERMSRRDALAELMPPAPDLEPLRLESVALQKQRDELAADLTISVEFAGARDRRIGLRLAEIDVELGAAARASVFEKFVDRTPREAWKLYDLEGKRAVIRALYEQIVVLPVGKGSHRFHPSQVPMVPRRGPSVGGASGEVDE